MSDEAHFKLTGHVNKQKGILSSFANDVYALNLSQCDVAFLKLGSLRCV